MTNVVVMKAILAPIGYIRIVCYIIASLGTFIVITKDLIFRIIMQ